MPDFPVLSCDCSETGANSKEYTHRTAFEACTCLLPLLSANREARVAEGFPASYASEALVKVKRHYVYGIRIPIYLLSVWG